MIVVEKAQGLEPDKGGVITALTFMWLSELGQVTDSKPQFVHSPHRDKYFIFTLKIKLCNDHKSTST